MDKSLEELRTTPHNFTTAHPPAPPEPRDVCSTCGLVRAAYVHRKG